MQVNLNKLTKNINSWFNNASDCKKIFARHKRSIHINNIIDNFRIVQTMDDAVEDNLKKRTTNRKKPSCYFNQNDIKFLLGVLEMQNQHIKATTHP